MNVSFPVMLNDSNYMIWRDQLLTYVIAYGLEGFIDGSLIPPSKFLAGSMALKVLELEHIELSF